MLNAAAFSLCSCFYSKHECHAADRHRWKIQFDDLVRVINWCFSQSGLQGCVVSGNNWQDNTRLRDDNARRR
jgi:hypothetical protein